MTPVRFCLGLGCAIGSILFSDPSDTLTPLLGSVAMILIFVVRVKFQIKKW